MNAGALVRYLVIALLGALTPRVALAAMPSGALPSMWTLVVLGIPLSVLAASIAGSAVRHLRASGHAEGSIPRVAVSTVLDGFIGGWIAMFLVGLPWTSKHLGPVLSTEVLGALCALLVEFVRTNGKVYLDQAYTGLVSRLSGRRPNQEDER